MITRDDVEDAARRTGTLVRRTPVTVLEPRDLVPGPVAPELEQLQHTGSEAPPRG